MGFVCCFGLLGLLGCSLIGVWLGGCGCLYCWGDWMLVFFVDGLVVGLCVLLMSLFGLFFFVLCVYG